VAARARFVGSNERRFFWLRMPGPQTRRSRKTSEWGVGTATVYRIKQRFVTEGLERALHESPRPGAPRKLGPEEESLLVAVACSKPPAGLARWTMDLLAGEMVRLTFLKTLSGDTLGRRLSEMSLKPWQEKMWCIPTVNPEYVARMEDVLALYAEPPDPLRPVVCFDETPRQLIGEDRVPIRAEPGKPARYDYEYVRNGTANVFMFVDVNRPLASRQGYRPAHLHRFCAVHAGPRG